MRMDDDEIRRMLEASTTHLADPGGTGQSPLSLIQQTLGSVPGAEPVRQAFAQFQHNPSEVSIRERLVTELGRLAQREPTFRVTLEQALSRLAQPEPPRAASRVPRPPSAYRPAEADEGRDRQQGTYRSMYSDNDTDQDDSRW